MSGTRVAVIGTGSWGTTFAQVLVDAGSDVVLWGRSAAVVEEITTQHTNVGYLPGITLPASLAATTDLAAAVDGASIVVMALPSQHLRAAATAVAGLLDPATVLVSLVKGVELSTGLRMSQVLGAATGVPADRIAVVSGPNLAHEIAQRQPTATVVASTSADTAATVAAACASTYFRPYTNSDVVGVELCGAVKNVIALAVGFSQGRGLGFNTMAALVTRGLTEIARLGAALGADQQTFGGLAGMGDLMATCASPDSRNHALGVHVGSGMSLDEALAVTGGTAEGVRSSRSVLELARSVDVDMPITDAVVRVLDGELEVAAMAEVLLSRPHKSEGV